MCVFVSVYAHLIQCWSQMGCSCTSKTTHPAVHCPLTGETLHLWGENMLRPLSHKVCHSSLCECVFVSVCVTVLPALLTTITALAYCVIQWMCVLYFINHPVPNLSLHSYQVKYRSDPPSQYCVLGNALCVCVWENITLAREHLISDVLFSQSKQSCNQIATVKRSLHWGSDIINCCEGLSLLFAAWHKPFDNLDMLCSNSTRAFSFKP